MRFLALGKAPVVILVATLASALYLSIHPVNESPANLHMWTFAKSHYDAYIDGIPAFEAAHPGVKVDVQLVSGVAVTSRLRAAFWSDLDVPDLVEVEISSAGSFFRGPMRDIGFSDLTNWLDQSGWGDRLVRSRFAPYTSRGRIFGIPHDVHPVMLAYRRDIFEQEGIDLSKVETWDEFVEIGRRMTRDLDGDGVPDRYMIELEDNGAGNMEMFLFQRDGGYFDKSGNLVMDSETALETLKWYVPLVAGPKKIANSLAGGQIFTQALESGYFLSIIAPDWRSRTTEMDVPRVSGKMALMPLPAVRTGGRRTSTWGGTMLGITKHCKNPELAREYAVHIYCDAKNLAKRFPSINIIPPLKEAWALPEFNDPRPYWSGQPLGKLYADLAEQTPSQYTSPFIGLAKAKLGEAVVACVLYYNRNGERGFDEFARRTLKSCADDVRKMMKRDPFQQSDAEHPGGRQ
ncbi:MAG TPA: extracellular solute-binding protein [Candidatus Brocadiia bacterium]|nr:extracellular solute-binding protein [Candidatus Brocadiia bacterium]